MPWGKSRWMTAAMLAASLMVPAAGAAQGLVAVKGHEFREQVNEPRAVSSTAVIGMLLRAGTAGQPVDGTRLWLRFARPLGEGQSVRIEVASADGRYRGQGLFTGQAGAGKWVQLTLLEGGRSRRPADIDPQDLAVKASLHEGAMPPVPVDASLADPSMQPPTVLRLHVNSRRADALTIAGTGGKAPCTRIASPSVPVFDHACDIGLDKVRRAKGSAPVVTVTRRQGFAYESFDVTVPVAPDGGR